MKTRGDKAPYTIMWNISGAEFLPCYDTSCVIFDSDPKLIKGEQKTHTIQVF